MKGRGGVGWRGHLLRFLVLLPVHVATRHRCLVVLLRCIHEGVGWGGVGWRGAFVDVPCASSGTCCYTAQMSDSVASLYTWRGGVGWGGGGHLLTFLVLLSVHVATLHRCLIVLLRCIHEGVGWVGGMLTFLVLLPVHVATLHRCLVVLLRCIHEGVGGRGQYQLPHWNNRCRMLCCQRLDPQIIVFKEQRSSPRCEVLAVEICESVHPSPAKSNFNAEAPALKRNQEKACQHAPTKWIQNPHEAWSLPNSRARIWHNLACRYVCFAVAKMFRLEKRCFYKHGFRSGCFCRSIFGWFSPMTFICGWVETTNH